MSPLARDLSDLPRPQREQRPGLTPDAEHRFGHVLAEAWAAQDAADGDLPRAHASSRFRHSDAGKCARAVAYAALDIPASDPMDLAGTHTVWLGRLVHEAWQKALAERYPGAEIEVTVGSGERSGHIDAVVTIPEGGAWIDVPDTDGSPASASGFLDLVVAIEGKTVGGFAYKMAVGERGPAQGPKFEHIVQASLNAIERGADQAVVVYWAKDCISIQAAERKGIGALTRFTAEWTLTREDFVPVAEREQKRVDGILALLDEGMLPARRFPDPELPKGHVLTDPRTGMWEQRDGDGRVVDTGTWWACAYCRWQALCAETPAERAPIDQVVALRDRAVA